MMQTHYATSMSPRAAKGLYEFTSEVERWLDTADHDRSADGLHSAHVGVA